ncbi:MAG TPA: MFS transporter, partial [Fimbriimonadaceae bacterium]|nr:MFS transporter [Fimbriimonadaceae bacterium]
MPVSLPSLRHRDFLIYTVGRFGGNVGSSVQMWAIAWQVYEVSGHSSLHVGLLGLARMVPLFMFSLIGGLVADHMDRKKLMLMTRVAMVVFALALWYVTIAHVDSLTVIYTIVALSSVARAFDGPARSSMMVNLVPEEDLPNALSVNGIAWRLSDVLGPVIAGFVIASSLGIAAAYVLSAVLDVILIVVLLSMGPINQVMPTTTVTNVREAFWQIGEGVTFIRHNAMVRNTMILDFWATFFSSADALFPAFAGPVLHIGARGYGVLAASAGIGALLAAVWLALRPTISRQGAVVIGMVGVYGMATVLFGTSRSLPLAMFFLACTGAADMISTVMRQTIRTLATPDEMRGRMAGVSVLFQVGGPQLGDVEAGVLAKAFNDRASVVIGGAASI